jgi:UDP-3-O-[3-hydroxymyristoyl] glucosamine N-acyltransferase
MEKIIYALGIGHNTPVFIDLAESCGYVVGGLYHYNGDRTGQIDHGFKIIGSFNDLLSKGNLDGMNFLLTMGDNERRTNLSERIINMGGKVPTLIHPMAVISRFSKISSVGVYISPFTYIQADSSVDSFTVLLSHVNISHSTHIGKSCFIAGMAVVGAYTNVEDYVFIGQGALSISGKVNSIGKFAYIGARSLITRDIPAYSVVAGSPARIIEKHEYK